MGNRETRQGTHTTTNQNTQKNNKAIKNVPPRTHTKPIMSELKILSIPNLYVLRVCAEMHPYIYPKTQFNTPEHDHNYIWTTQVHEHKTRQTTSGQQYIPLTKRRNSKKKLKYSLNHLTTKYSKIWNTVPIEIRKKNSLQTFKKHLKHFLLERQTRQYLQEKHS